MSTKKCCTCNKIKETNEFNKNTRHKDRLSSYCRQCSSEQWKRYQENNLEKEAGRKKRWYAKNIKRRSKTNRAWRGKNKERQAGLGKLWREANRERVIEKTRRRRTIQANLPFIWDEIIDGGNVKPNEKRRIGQLRVYGLGRSLRFEGII